MNAKLYVGNLSYEIENIDLQKLFESCGTVVSINVVTDRDTGRTKGFGFIEMENRDEAQKAIDTLNEQDLLGRTIKVNFAKPRRAA